MNNIYIHESSFVGENAKIGDGTKIWQFCNIMDDSELGKNCSIGQNVFVESGVIVGNNVKIKNNISLYTGVICEDDVFLGPNCVFTNVLNPRSFIEKKGEFKTTLIKKGATIGANATIVCGNIIGEYALIGAGAVVTKNVPNYALIYGNPAQIKGYVCKCGEPLRAIQDGYQCDICKKKYHIENGEIVLTFLHV